MLVSKNDVMKVIANLPDQITLCDIQSLLVLFEDKQPTSTLSCLELAEQYHLVGILENAPIDLSHNPIYLQGYGK